MVGANAVRAEWRAAMETLGDSYVANAGQKIVHLEAEGYGAD